MKGSKMERAGGETEEEGRDTEGERGWRGETWMREKWREERGDKSREREL